jgi:hypothetical protein
LRDPAKVASAGADETVVKPFIILVAALVCAAPASAKVKKPLLQEREVAPISAAAPFNPDEAVRQIRARMSGVRACYERASRFDPGLRGKLQLGFDISDSGQVASTQVELNGLRVDVDQSIATAMTSCIRSQALAWRLAAEGPAGGAHVSYVFVFEAAH